MNPLKKIAKQSLQKAGISVRRRAPFLLQNPDKEMPVLFPFVLAHHALRNATAPFFFIQVGAFDGVTNDPINEFVRDLKWEGLLIEPQSGPFAKLKESYRDQPQLQFVQAAISDTDGTKPFYRVRNDIEGIPEITQQLASFNKEVLLSHTAFYADIANAVITEQIPTLSFATLLRDYHVSKVDLLQIDAEGYDFEVLKLFPFEQVRPAVIHYEHKHLGADVENSWRHLAERDYLLCHNHEDTTAYRHDLCPPDGF